MTTSAVSEPAFLQRTRLSLLAPMLVAGAYYLGAEAAFSIGTLTQQFAPFWPPNVVLLCALLLLPRRQWPLCIAAAFPAHVLAEWGAAMPLPQLLLAFGSNVCVALLNAIALTRFVRGPPWLTSLRSVSLYLLCAVIVNPGLVALSGGLEPILGGGNPSDYWQFWWRWYLSNALGNLTLTPVFLTALHNGRDVLPRMPTRRRLIEAASLTLALVAAGSAAFDMELTRITAGLFPAMLYLPLPLLLAAAVRFGPKGASRAILILTIMVLFGAMHDHGPFADAPPGRDVLGAQLFLAISAVPVMLLAGVIQELRQANQKLVGVLDGISDCYYTLDSSGHITAINANTAEWWGVATPGDLIGRSYWEVALNKPEEQAWVRHAMRAGRATHAEVVTSDGRWAEMHGYPMAGGVSIFCHDATERRTAEAAARQTQTLLQSSLDALKVQIAILESSGKIIATNAAWRAATEAINRRKGECTCLPSANFLEEYGNGQPHQRAIAAGVRKIIADGFGEFRFEFPGNVTEGTWFQLAATCFGSGPELRLVVANADITEVKTSESALRRLTGKLLRAQDETARRIARDLHDSTAQNLLAATLGVGHALRSRPPLSEVVRAALEESRSLIEQSQREIRTVAYLLHPPMLDEAGLPAALRWFCDGFAKRTEIAVDLNVGGDIARLPNGIEATLFRIAQEGLSNVHRHSGSSTARIALNLAASPTGGRSISLSIEDDGRGIPAIMEEPFNNLTRLRELQNTGIGLAGMRERLHQLGGNLEIRSSLQGTVVSVVIPLSSEGSLRPDNPEVRPVVVV